jgi:hypothetical protein
MTQIRTFSYGLALAWSDCEWERVPLLTRARLTLGTRPRWLPALCTRMLAHFSRNPGDAGVLSRFIELDWKLHGWLTAARLPRIQKWRFPAPQMVPVDGPPASFRVPWIETEAALAAWLGVTPAQLDWYADTQRRNAARCAPKLRHYTYRWVKKRSQGYRLLETPKRQLKALQRMIAQNLLSRVPPSAAAHGFVRARSVLSFVEPHVGQRVVLRLDLEDFFSEIVQARVRAVFARVGYPSAVAHKLAGVCCAPAPGDVLREQPRLDGDPQARFQQAARLGKAHLPQGAPSSPALSNLVAFRLDRRLAGLARAAGADFTRYADDLAFSGGRSFERGLSTFIARVAAIASEEGFRVRYRKTRVMRSGDRQMLAGLVINRRINVSRSEYAVLRALLHNAARFGPDSQNRAKHPDFRAHLLGRIAWIAQTHATRGERLRQLFARIDWSGSVSATDT